MSQECDPERHPQDQLADAGVRCEYTVEHARLPLSSPRSSQCRSLWPGAESNCRHADFQFSRVAPPDPVHRTAPLTTRYDASTSAAAPGGRCADNRRVCLMVRGAMGGQTLDSGSGLLRSEWLDPSQNQYCNNGEGDPDEHPTLKREMLLPRVPFPSLPYWDGRAHTFRQGSVWIQGPPERGDV